MATVADPAGVMSDRLAPFSSSFTRPRRRRVLALVGGALLAPQRRTAGAALRATGQGQDRGFVP
jgi:hypothetical protein